MSELRLSLFDHATDSPPKPLVTTWKAFVASLSPHRFDIADKRRVPVFSPAEFPAGAQRRFKRNVVRVWFGVLDLDGITTTQLSMVWDRLEGLDAAMYTTWSHPGVASLGLWKVRICIRFSRPAETAEWPTLWRAMNAQFCGLNDPSTKDQGHIYFYPSAPPGTDPALCKLAVFEGKALDIDALPTAAMSAAPLRQDKITREHLERLATRWKRSRDFYKEEMGQALAKVVRGEAFAENGNVDNKIFELIKDLAKALPQADPESVIVHFAQSLQLMAYDGKPPHTIEDVRSKFERAQQRIQEDDFAAEQEKTTQRKILISEAFESIDPGRETPYTSEEIDAIASACKCTRKKLTRRWIIACGEVYYLLGPNGRYGAPYQEKRFFDVVLSKLAPAETAGVDLWTLTSSGGRIRKKPDHLMADYGRAPAYYEVDLRAQRSEFDPDRDCFVEAPCPLRPLIPAYDPEIDEWLKILTGPHYANVLTWIAQVTNLNRIFAALVLTGKAGTGKTLLAKGLSRLWTTQGTTKFMSALSDFNSALSNCPLVLADEELPKDFRGDERTGEIREFISDLERPFKQKYKPEGKILGAVRLMVTSNDENVLSFKKGHLNGFSIGALSDRFYLVPVNSEAADFLQARDVSTFVAGDRIARHALWLRDNHPIPEVNWRFGIKNSDDDHFHGQVVQTETNYAVCKWLVSYLRSPERIDNRGDFGVRIKDGKLYVNALVLLDSWDVYSRENPPRPEHISKAIASDLSSGRVTISRPKDLKRITYRQIRTECLYVWSKTTDFATREEIDAALAVDTEARISRVKTMM